MEEKKDKRRRPLENKLVIAMRDHIYDKELGREILQYGVPKLAKELNISYVHLYNCLKGRSVLKEETAIEAKRIIRLAKKK